MSKTIEELEKKLKKLCAVELPIPDLVLEPIDLSQGDKSNHPDINTEDYYLVFHGGRFDAGKFSKVWYGLSFSGLYNYQFNTPGYNSSRWRAVWRITNADVLLDHTGKERRAMQELLSAEREKEDDESWD